MCSVAFFLNQKERTKRLSFLLESVRLGYKDCFSIVYEYPTQWDQMIFEGAFLFSCLRYFFSIHKVCTVQFYPQPIKEDVENLQVVIK